MEKKGNRNLPAARGSATDSKKQDGVSGKPWPRGGRRREPSGPSFASKSDPSRKPQPQRVKTIDKRPKPRGQFYPGAVARNETSGLAEDEAELGSVFLPGSKKQSLNHLLNFSYSPREVYQPQRGPNKAGGRLLITKKHKYNKEHFLQANCQFIVNDSGDYVQYMNNPDALVDWNFIEQVNVQVSEFPSCPICLYPPVAAKMTRCGHIYCWSCLLHYLALSDKPSRKCPICYESVHKNDLKSVIAIPHTTFNVNETITFKLMKRQRGSLTAYPADQLLKNNNTLFDMSEKDAANIYSKLLLANNSNILSIIERESNELHVQLAEDANCPEKCFIEQAIATLKEREGRVLENIQNKNLADENTKEKIQVDAVNMLEQSLTDVNLNNTADGDLFTVEDVLDNATPEDVNISANQPSKFHYFYQASDGQHIYLHAINARMIEHSYGSLEFGPKTISGKILEKEGGSMTEDLRKRLRYLQHLPVTCQFEVAEIQLRQPVVNKETLDDFQEQIEVRRKKRQRRAKEEKRRERRIETEENRKMGKYPAPNLHLESHLQFPEFGVEPRLRTESECTLPSLASERSSSPSFSVGTPAEHVYAGPSFATMLALEKKQAPAWTGLKQTGALAQAAPQKLITVTGTKMASTVKPRNTNDSDPELDDYEPVPDFNASFGDAIAQALQKTENIEEDGPSVSGKKKKSKNKKKVLFSTNMAYMGN